MNEKLYLIALAVACTSGASELPRDSSDVTLLVAFFFFFFVWAMMCGVCLFFYSKNNNGYFPDL